MSDHVMYSRKEAAAYIGIAVSTLDVAIGRGLIRSRRIGRRILVHKVELDRFVRTDHPEIWPKRTARKADQAQATI